MAHCGRTVNASHGRLFAWACPTSSSYIPTYTISPTDLNQSHSVRGSYVVVLCRDPRTLAIGEGFC